MNKRLVVRVSWPELDYMPDRETSSKQSELGYKSVDHLRAELKKRWSRKDVTDIPKGVRYSERSELGLQVFEVTLR